MLLALLLAVQAPASALPMSNAPRPDVVVTGKRLERIYELCRKSRCTPLRDAQASIAWAEARFRDGEYLAAKKILRDAAARNKRHAMTDPKPVAAIYEAYATVSWQEGDQATYQRATADRVRTLRDHLPADDVAVRGAALALGDARLRLGYPREAERLYRDAEVRAAAAGHGDVALRARLARAAVGHRLGDKREAAVLLATAGALAPGEPWAGSVIQAMRVRLAAVDGDDRERERLAIALGRAGLARPMLIHQPPMPETTAERARAARAQGLPTMPGSAPVLFGPGERPTLEPLQWADVGFWIRPDGRTAEVEALSGSPDRRWTGAIVTQVAGRRYSATPGTPAGDPGFYRLERFTLRPQYTVGPVTGSLISAKSGPQRLEVLDLTDPSAKVTASR